MMEPFDELNRAVKELFAVIWNEFLNTPIGRLMERYPFATLIVGMIVLWLLIVIGLNSPPPQQ